MSSRGREKSKIINRLTLSTMMSQITMLETKLQRKIRRSNRVAPLRPIWQRQQSHVASCSAISCTILASDASNTKRFSTCAVWNQFHLIWRTVQAAHSVSMTPCRLLLSECLRSASIDDPPFNSCKTQLHSSKIRPANCLQKCRVNSLGKTKCLCWTLHRESRSSQDSSIRQIV